MSGSRLLTLLLSDLNRHKNRIRKGDTKMKQPMDEWFYTGTKATYGTFDAAAAADGGSVILPHLTDLTDTAHGLLAGSLLYIQATDYYNGLRKVVSLPDANSMVIYAKFVAETLANTDTWKTMFTYDNWINGSLVAGPDYEFCGFEVTLDAASATSENLVITVDAAFGSAFDTEIYSKDMNGIQHINYMFDEPRRLSGGDKIDVVWVNTNAKTWGIKLFTRRLV